MTLLVWYVVYLAIVPAIVEHVHEPAAAGVVAGGEGHLPPHLPPAPLLVHLPLSSLATSTVEPLHPRAP